MEEAVALVTSPAVAKALVTSPAVAKAQALALAAVPVEEDIDILDTRSHQL
jgi:hypothetical protein